MCNCEKNTSQVDLLRINWTELNWTERVTYLLVTSSLKSFRNIFVAFPNVYRLCTNLLHLMHECAQVGHIRAEWRHLLYVKYEAERISLSNNFQWAKVSKIVHCQTLINYFSLASTILVTQESGFIYIFCTNVPHSPLEFCGRHFTSNEKLKAVGTFCIWSIFNVTTRDFFT